MAEVKQSYRKKQAYLVILVFACIGIAIWGHSAAVSVGAILAACGISFYAATLEPEKSPEEHHHHH
jgi:predicted signal transduction protein with EAL and GGDEF domain